MPQYAEAINRHVAIGLLALVAASAPAVSWAQRRDPAGATELFRQGRDALTAGDFTTACPKFAESQRLDPKVGTLLNLADCEEKLGNLASALNAWQQAVDLAAATKDERAQVAHQRLTALGPRVPRLSVRLDAAAPANTRVFRNDVELGPAALGTPLPVEIGTHRLTAKAPGRADRTVLVKIHEGQTREVLLSIAGAPSAPPARIEPTPKKPTQDRTDDKTWAYVLGGVGAAGAILAGVTGVMLINTNKTIDAHCTPNNVCDAEGLDAADGGGRLVLLNAVGWAVGVAGLGLGAYLYLSSPDPGSGATHGNREAGIGLRGAF